MDFIVLAIILVVVTIVTEVPNAKPVVARGDGVSHD